MFSMLASQPCIHATQFTYVLVVVIVVVVVVYIILSEVWVEVVTTPLCFIQRRLLYDQTKSNKSHVAASKPEVPMS